MAPRRGRRLLSALALTGLLSWLPRGRLWVSGFTGTYARMCVRPLGSAPALRAGFGSEDSQKARGKARADEGPCPCLSGEPYAACCGLVHSDFRTASSPEVLARARYSALALRKPKFLMDTTHSSHPEYTEDRNAWTRQILQNIEQIRFAGIMVTKSESQGEDEHAVTFEAAIEPVSRNGEVQVLLLRERSIYRRDGSSWFYAKAEDLAREVVEGAAAKQTLAADRFRRKRS